MNYCYTDECDCPYYLADCGGCLLTNPQLDCENYAAFMADEDEVMGMVDMFALNP